MASEESRVDNANNDAKQTDNASELSLVTLSANPEQKTKNPSPDDTVSPLHNNDPIKARDRLIDEAVEQLGVNPDQVTPEAKFIEDLGADSLDTVELVMALEEEFGNEIPDEQAEKLQSVGDVIKYIEDSQKK